MGIVLAVVAGLLLALEILTTTFYLLAVVVALAVGSAVALMGFAPDRALGAVALIALVALPAAHIIRRGFSGQIAEWAKLAAPDTGKLVRVEHVSVEGLRVAYRGSVWQGRLTKQQCEVTVSPGDMLQIVGRDGNDLVLTPLETLQDKNKRRV